MSSEYADFNLLLASAELAPAGPAYYEARRKLWLTPRPARTALAPKPDPMHRRKLEMHLGPSGAVECDESRKTMRGLWKGICTGKRLRERIPLRLMITVVRAAWIQDETWPKDAVVQTSDEAPLA